MNNGYGNEIYFDEITILRAANDASRQRDMTATSMSLANNNMVTIYQPNYNNFFDTIFLHIKASRITIQMDMSMLSRVPHACFSVYQTAIWQIHLQIHQRINVNCP
jgi:hypothetical protein